MPRSVVLALLACHLSALLWMPIALGLGSLMAMQRWTQVMFLGSLAMASDLGHSANFAGMLWLVLTTMVSLMAVLWMPLAIAVLMNIRSLNLNNGNQDSMSDSRRSLEFGLADRCDRILRQQALWVFNWLLTGVGLLSLALWIVSQFDRVGFPEENTGWVTWSLAGWVILLAIAQVGMAGVGIRRSFQGKSFRYVFSIPFLRLPIASK